MAVDVKLSEAMSEYVTGVAVEHRPAVARELQRFGRWFGSDRLVRTVTRLDLERYQAQQEDNGSGNSTRLEPLKDFFTFARKRKLLDEAVATALRIKRRMNLNGAAGKIDSDRPEVQQVQLTPAGLEQLQSQLERLDIVERPAAEEELHLAAADKDFRENAPYDAAKQHLAEIHRKMNEIKATIAAGRVVEVTNTARVRIGMTVVVADLEEDEEISYTLVGPGEIDARQGKISIQSPVGQALDLRGVGDTVEVSVPAGVVRYRIVRIERGS
ncbi:MAG: GreA/GreB family elongation factor [Chloroflexota bacterium]